VAFNSSRAEGQLLLAPGVQCTVGRLRATIAAAAVDRLAAVRTDSGASIGRPSALAVLFARLVERRRGAAVRGAEIDRAERRLIARHFDGDAAAYTAALSEHDLTRGDARRLLADEVRHAKIAGKLRSPSRFRSWRASALENVLTSTTCLQDELPPTTHVDMSAQLKFLQITR
jgi:hypothetical protein